ncbi:MAG: hypothetical protein ABG776_06870 [Cyanobacteria bacterium J06555_13]
MKNQYVQFKGKKEGFCNICGLNGALTRDHIPPKGCVSPTLVELKTLSQYLTEPIGNRGTLSQSGLNIRSICENCNSGLLGAQYDQSLIDLSQRVTGLVRASQQQGIVLPARTSVTVNPQRLVRAVVGHVLAGKPPSSKSAPKSAPYPDALRQYFLDPSRNIPPELEVYYWLYPSNQQIVINSLGFASTEGKGCIPGSCLLKFFPLAFWLVWDKPNTFPINAEKISASAFQGIDDTCEIALDLKNIPSINYPEEPNDRYALMLRNDSTFLATPKSQKG